MKIKKKNINIKMIKIMIKKKLLKLKKIKK